MVQIKTIYRYFIFYLFVVNTLDTIVPKEDHKSPTELFKRDQTRQKESGDSGADSIQSQQDSPLNIGIVLK